MFMTTVDNLMILNSLGGAITKAWDSITQEKLDLLVKSMPKRINQVIKTGGHFTDY